MSGTNKIASSGFLLTTISLISGITVRVLCFILIFGLVVITVYRYKKKNTKRQSPIHTANNPLAVLHHANTNLA